MISTKESKNAAIYYLYKKGSRYFKGLRFEHTIFGEEESINRNKKNIENWDNKMRIIKHKHKDIGDVFDNLFDNED